MMTATYSPDDNKLRLYSVSRLDNETYARVKAAGFIWAPKQRLFVAPMWTPEREDLLIELAGEIDDEDASLVDRAEERAERFEGYQENRAKDAERAQKAVAAIADNIPLGQPILIGHHSERHARRDATRIENGMRKAVDMWETSQYWKSRAAGAIRHAKYKELPGVRARRIKGIEADQRKTQRTKDEAESFLKLWSAEGVTHEQALAIANVSSFHLPRKDGDRPDWQYTPTAYDALTGSSPTLYAPRTLEEVLEAAKTLYPGIIARCDRWLTHYANRLEYERAMLAEAGGLVSDRQTFEVGGQVLRRYGKWFIITKVNAGSVSVIGHFAGTIPFDEIKEYKPPQAGDTEKVKAATKLPPLCNYPGEGFTHMTKAEMKADRWRMYSDSPKTGVIKATDTHGAHRVQQTRGKDVWSSVPVYVTDAPRKDPPAKATPPALPERECTAPTIRPHQPPAPTVYDAMKDSLKAGVQTVSAPQLFPTPPAIVAQMVEKADLQPGQRRLEPEAGTGHLIEAMADVPGEIVAVEINAALVTQLRRRWDDGSVDIRLGDFLACNGELGTFDRILMNPPFGSADDVKHILHARHFLKPGGKLVALCANGPRQQEQLKPIAETWEILPEGSFQEAGTNVRVALLTIQG
mgnify:FL=1